MAGRCRPEVVSTRVTPEEKAVIRAAASYKGEPVSEFVHLIVVRNARAVLADRLGLRSADVTEVNPEPDATT